MQTQAFTSLNQWIAYLSVQTPPILTQTRQQMNACQQRIDELDLHEIGALIRHDPLLTLNVLRYQEEHRQSRQITDITTIERVLLMIGVAGFFRLFGAIDSIEAQQDIQKVSILGAHRTCSRSHLAACFAETLGKQRRDIEPNEVVTAALLHDTAETLLWLASPRQMMEIQEMLRANPSLRSNDVQIQILGCKINDIQRALVEKWHLPHTLLHLIDDKFAQEPRVHIVNLAVAMARHLEKGWDSPFLRNDIAQCAVLFNTEPDFIYADIRNTALHAARSWHWYGERPAAALLIRA
jgi:HD-like signal output (HDOD) protein